jgi:hypothetical protein
MTVASPVIAALCLQDHGLRGRMRRPCSVTPAVLWMMTHPSSTATAPVPQRNSIVANPVTARIGGEWSSCGTRSNRRCWMPCFRRSRRCARRSGCCSDSVPQTLLRPAQLLVQPANTMVERLFDGEAARLVLMGNAMHADAPLDAPAVV